MISMNLSESLRHAALLTGLSILQISKRADIPYQAAYGFLKSDRDIRISTAAKIAKVVGVELRPVAKPSTAKRSKSKSR